VDDDSEGEEVVEVVENHPVYSRHYEQQNDEEQDSDSEDSVPSDTDESEDEIDKDELQIHLLSGTNDVIQEIMSDMIDYVVYTIEGEEEVLGNQNEEVNRSDNTILYELLLLFIDLILIELIIIEMKKKKNILNQ
jgi:cobalamin biosynthesis protein CobT